MRWPDEPFNDDGTYSPEWISNRTRVCKEMLDGARWGLFNIRNNDEKKVRKKFYHFQDDDGFMFTMLIRTVEYAIDMLWAIDPQNSKQWRELCATFASEGRDWKRENMKCPHDPKIHKKD